MAHLIPLKNRQAGNLAKAFVRELWRLHNLPLGVVSDTDTVFSSKLWSEIMRVLNISQDMSNAFNTQTDGQTETVNQVLEHYLRTFCARDQKDRVDLLPYAGLCYINTRVYCSHKMILFYVNFGYHTGDNYPDEVMDSNVPAAKKYILKLEKVTKDMRDTLMLTKERMAKYYNKSVADNKPKFKVGDKVMVNGKNIKTIRPTKKLDQKIRGALKVERLVEPYAYELEIPAFVGRPHTVYHLLLLEQYPMNQIDGRQSPTPPPLLDLRPNEYEIESIKVSQPVKGQVLYLCHWEGYYNDHITCELYKNLMNGAEEIVRDLDLNNPCQEGDSRVEVWML